MKHLAKLVLLVLAGVLTILLAGMLVVLTMSRSREETVYAVRPRMVTVPQTETARTEGERLYFARGCAECHGQDGTGKIIVDAAIGRFVGNNLTQVVPQRTDEDLVRAIRHGIGVDGKPLMLMPANEYFRMSDDDLGQLIAYLRGMKPKPGVDEKCEARTLGRVLHVAGMLDLFTAEKIDHEAPAPTTVTAADTVEYGAYLAIGCTGCHGEGLSGGKIPGAPPEMGVPSNLTPHESGLGAWKLEDFVRAMREGKRPDGSAIDPKQMPWTSLSRMSDLELSALYRYLQSLPPKPAGGR